MACPAMLISVRRFARAESVAGFMAVKLKFLDLRRPTVSEKRKYKFNWDNTIGADMAAARPALGPSTRVEVYRLFQFTLRDVLEDRYGTVAADEIFRDAGAMAGRAFFYKFCGDAKDVPTLVKIISEKFREFGIGILRVEKQDLDKLSFTVTVDEDLDCSGMPDTEDVVCVYDEGFIQGILEAFSGRTFDVREVDCWAMGARTCRFGAQGH
jgi:predicted hydrocarbon binding protein